MQKLSEALASAYQFSASTLFNFLGVFSAPLAVIAVIRFTGGAWWPALVAVCAINLIPIVGPILSFIGMLVGAYLYVAAGLDWRAAMHLPL